VNEIIDNHALYANQEFDSDYNGKLFARLLSLYIPDHIYLGDFMGFADGILTGGVIGRIIGGLLDKIVKRKLPAQKKL
jgi:hypothetical protein